MDRNRQIGHYEVRRFRGTEIEAVFSDLALLRIQIFREYPYLYEGDFEYEKKYLKRYSSSSRGFLAALYDKDNLIGAATALPLYDEEDFVQKPFLDLGWPVEDVFYFGESLLLPAYRGQGLGHVFFDERERFAQQNSNMKTTAFCAVVRPDNHPAKPSNYKPLNGFWEKRGYHCEPELRSEFSWVDLGSKQESLKPMQFWIKEWLR